MNKRRKVGRRLGSRNHRFGVPTQLRKQPQGRGNLGYAAVLARPHAAIPVDHLRRRDTAKLQIVDAVVAAGVVSQQLVGGHVARRVKLDAVDRAAVDRDRLCHQLSWRGDHFGFDQPQVKLHSRQPLIVNQQAKRLAVGDDRLTHRPQLAGQVDLPRPVEKRAGNFTICLNAAGVQLQPRACANQIGRQGGRDAGQVAVVVSFVARPIPHFATLHRCQGGIGTQGVSVGPVPPVFAALGRVKASTHPLGRYGFRLLRLAEQSKH